jgi:hypothetical protein
MPIFGRWSFGREFTRKAELYATALFAEPSDADVEWLTSAATRGDDDHARWELRYLRRALGMLTAQRDALDDRTASAVAAALDNAFRGDQRIDPDMYAVAKQQFNARLAAYSDIISSRPGVAHARGRPNPVTTAQRLGQMLLAFAGGPVSSTPEQTQAAGVIAARYLDESNAELQQIFGAASLPEDLAPSQL